MYTFKNVRYFSSAQHFFILSLRQLLIDSLCIEGIANNLVILNGNESKLHFKAGPEDNSLYYLSGFEKVEKKRNIVVVILTDLAHKHFAHLSKKVLRKFPSATIGFLVVTGKLSTTFCSRCAQGKMHQHAFPLSKHCANEPFEMIHSNLKLFPIESYHWYKYVIVFYDNYSLHAWISCLRQKLSAIVATKQFLAMVKTQHKPYKVI
jgi:hypothetical protein